MTMALMILVNNPGSWSHIHPPLRHASWHGWTITDWVFPFFLFIVGAAIPFALGRRLDEGAQRGPIVRKILIRGTLLWIIGLGLACLRWLITTDGLDFAVGEWPWGELRILGVLPRIGICYAIAGLLFVATRPRTQVLIGAGILAAYWPLIAYTPNPDLAAPAGSLPMDAAGTHIGAWVDQTVLGAGHIWSGSKVYDPEGIVSTLPAVVTVLFGVFAGRLLRRRDRGPTTKSLALLGAGLVCTAVGLAWDQVLPINKPLWTSSYTVFTAGCAMGILGLCHLVFDALGARAAATRALAKPFVIYGVNALLVFVGSAVASHIVRKWCRFTVVRDGTATDVSVQQWLFQDVFRDSWGLSAVNASLGYALAWITVWFAILAVLYRFKIIWKI